MTWEEKLLNLFSSLGQDPLEDAIGYMEADGLSTKKWIEYIDTAVKASEYQNPIVVEIINSGNGYKIYEPIEARSYFIELGYLYLKSHV